MPKGMQPIYRQVLGSSASTVTFNNIPQTFTDLKILINGKGTSANVSTVYMQINGVNSGYLGTVGYGETSGSGSFSIATTGVHCGYITGSVIDANATGITDIYIPNYRSNSFKQITSMGFSEGNASTYQASVQSQHANISRSHAPVVSLTFFTDSTAYAANTSFTLYGIGV